MLEQIQNRQVLDEVMLSPSYLIKEVWEIQNSNFSHFLGLTLSNLLELEGKDKGTDMNPNLNEWIGKTLKERKAECMKRNSRSDWLITETNIESEMDRCSQEKVSFYLVLRWLQYEMGQMKQGSAGAKKDHLLSLLTQSSSQASKQGPTKLRTQKELLAMCYFQYLESNQFISFEGNKQYKSYLFANALESGSSDFEESVLILLEMLRIYFPAGNPIDHA